MKKTRIIFYNRNNVILKADKKQNNTFSISYEEKNKTKIRGISAIKSTDIDTLFEGNLLHFRTQYMIDDYNDNYIDMSFPLINIELTDDEKNILLDFIKEDEDK